MKRKILFALPLVILMGAFFLALAIILSCVRIPAFFDILKTYLGI